MSGTQTIALFLLLIPMMGVVVSLILLHRSFRRYQRLHGGGGDEASHIALVRAVQIEVLFFILQLGYLIHGVYAAKYSFELPPSTLVAGMIIRTSQSLLVFIQEVLDMRASARILRLRKKDTSDGSPSGKNG